VAHNGSSAAGQKFVVAGLEVPTEEQRVFGVMRTQEIAQGMRVDKGVVIRAQEPIRVREVVFVDVHPSQHALAPQEVPIFLLSRR